MVICSLPSSEALRQVAGELAAAGRPTLDRYRNQHTAPRRQGGRAAHARRGWGDAARLPAERNRIAGAGKRSRRARERRPPRVSQGGAPVLDAFARARFHVGDFGAGSKMEFAANLLVAIHNVAAAEALVLAMKAGLDPATAFDVISAGAGSIAHVRGARADDGKRRPFPRVDEARRLAEGHDRDRRVCPRGRVRRRRCSR